MDFLDDLSDRVGKNSQNWMPLYAMIENAKVPKILKSQGYKFIHVGADGNPTRENRFADINVSYHLPPEFLMELYETTLFFPLFEEFEILNFGFHHWKEVLYKFDKIAGIRQIKEPTFTFAHFLLPHEPYVFDQDGHFLSRAEKQGRSIRGNYVNQVIFANKKVLDLIDKLIAEKENVPIIILQADEGPYPLRFQSGDRFIWKDLSLPELREKTRILNAYFLPGVDQNILYPSLSPVNTFRIVFNLYFGTEFPLLPDKSFALANWGDIYNFVDITSLVQYGGISRK